VHGWILGKIGLNVKFTFRENFVMIQFMIFANEKNRSKKISQ